MWIPYPFLQDHEIDTTDALPITEGPSLEKMYELDLGLELSPDDVLDFMTPQGLVTVQLENFIQDPKIPDAWWLSGWVRNEPGETIVGIHYCPERSHEIYLCREDAMINCP